MTIHTMGVPLLSTKQIEKLVHHFFIFTFMENLHKCHISSCRAIAVTPRLDSFFPANVNQQLLRHGIMYACSSQDKDYDAYANSLLFSIVLRVVTLDLFCFSIRYSQ